jgi:biotin carboxylase
MAYRKRLLLIAATTGYQIREFHKAAERLGLDIRLATDRCHNLDDPWGDDAIPIRFHLPEEAASHIESLGSFDAIVAVGDWPTVAAAAVARRMGIAYNSPEAVDAARNKHRARDCFREEGLPVPRYYQLPVDSDENVEARAAPFPCVLKPLGLSASRGVIRANDQRQFVAAFRRIRAILSSPEIRRLKDEPDRYLQVEGFILGREYALEGLLTAGRLQTLALFDKPDPLDGPYFEETIYVTPSRLPEVEQHRISDAAQVAVRALGLTHGPIHAEMRLNDEGVWMLEVAARPIGGLCARALRFNNGTPLEELILRHAIGEDVSKAGLDGPSSGVMMIPIPKAGVYEDVEGVAEAEAVEGIEEVVITAKRGQELRPLPEGATYLGFIFARGESSAEVEGSLREAHARLSFRIAGVLPVARTPSVSETSSP